MAAPVITSIAPVRGPSTGQTLVTITGMAMRLPSPPPATGPTSGRIRPTVELRIGGVPASRVAVRVDPANPPDGTVAMCLTPPGTPGAADIVLCNLDDAGQPIAGEVALLPGGFIYERADLAAESDLTRLVRTLLRALKAQVIDNVSLTVHTDFDADPGDGLHITQIAALPALILAGPELVENRFYSLNQPLIDGGGDAPGLPFVVRRVPYTVDLGFTLIGISAHTTELLNLMAQCTRFLHKNKTLAMDRDPQSPAAGRVAYEMDFAPGGQLRARSQPSDSNVRHFTGEIVIRGFDIDEPAGIAIDEGRTSGAATLASEQREA